MAKTAPKAPNLTVAEFEGMFEAVKNWGRWGKADDRGTLNYITPEHVRRAASLVRAGRTVSMAIPINTVAGPDNPHPAIHYMSQNHDIPVGTSKVGFAMDFLAMECHGDCPPYEMWLSASMWVWQSPWHSIARKSIAKPTFEVPTGMS